MRNGHYPTLFRKPKSRFHYLCTRSPALFVPLHVSMECTHHTNSGLFTSQSIDKFLWPNSQPTAIFVLFDLFDPKIHPSLNKMPKLTSISKIKVTNLWNVTPKYCYVLLATSSYVASKGNESLKYSSLTLWGGQQRLGSSFSLTKLFFDQIWNMYSSLLS